MNALFVLLCVSVLPCDEPVQGVTRLSPEDYTSPQFKFLSRYNFGLSCVSLPCETFFKNCFELCGCKEKFKYRI